MYRGTYVHSTGTVGVQGDICTQYSYSRCTGGHMYTVQLLLVCVRTHEHDINWLVCPFGACCTAI